MRWQAMEVRWEQRCEIEPKARLPAPFVELGEGALGEAAELCAAAGLQQPFRTAILKLADAGGAEGDSQQHGSMEASSAAGAGAPLLTPA